MRSTRTIEVLAAKRAVGIRGGRPRSCPREVLAHIVQRRREGRLYREICDELNAGGVATPGNGARWRPDTISRLLDRYDARHATDIDPRVGKT